MRDAGQVLIEHLPRKGKAAWFDRSGLSHETPDIRFGVLVALVSAGLNVSVQAQTVPSYVVDAQLPIVSSDGFNDPQGLVVASGGTVYVADSGNHRLLKIAPDGTQTR